MIKTFAAEVTAVRVCGVTIMWNLPFDPWLFWLLAATTALLALCVVLRSRTLAHTPARTLVYCLRALIVAAVIVILADPVMPVLVSRKDEVRPHVVLVDTSRSMSLGTPTSRLELARAALAPLLEAHRSQGTIAVFEFDRGLRTPSSAAFPAEAAGDGTFLARALAEVLDEPSRLPPADVLVVSDGRIHDAPHLADAAALARRREVPVSAFVPTPSIPFVNLSIEQCVVERKVPPATRVSIRVLLRAAGASGERCMLTLTDGDGSTRATLPFTAHDGIGAYDLYVDVGDRAVTYTLEVTVLPGEITDLDNRHEFRIDVLAPTLRVLYMEGTHEKLRWDRWEHEFLEFALKGDGIEVDTYYVDSQFSTTGRLCSVKDASRGFPATREELTRYDVIIASDVNRSIITDEQKRWTVDLVAEEGRGFCMIGGHTSFGSGDYDQTLWETLVPVDMALEGTEGCIQEEFRVEFPPDARGHPILRIALDPDTNWKILQAIPPFLGTNLVSRAKPGATVLALHAVRRMPVICVQSYGKGRTMAFAPDTTDMWGRYFETQWGVGARDNRYFNRFWANAVRWLGEHSTGRRQSSVQGDTERVSYGPGETVAVTARLVQGSATADTVDPARARVTCRAGTGTAVVLHYDAQRKEYVGALELPPVLPDPELTIAFEARAGAGSLGQDSVVIRVRKDFRELVDPRPDEDTLVGLARAAGGTLLTSNDEIRTLLEKTVTAKGAARTYLVPRWDRPWVWATLLGLLTVEWILRKFARGTSRPIPR